MSRLNAIVARLGGVLYDGGRRALIPGPGHAPHDRSVSLLETPKGRVLVHCFSPKDDAGAVAAWLAGEGFVAAVGRDHADYPLRSDRAARAQFLWSQARPLGGTPAARYLRTRGIDELATNDALRFHPAASSLDDRARRPALLAAISDGAGRVQGVEILLLTLGGARKAPVATPRRIVGKLSGGAVRLAEPNESLLVAEGVVTALSASLALQLPAWAALSAHNLARFSPPEAVRRLVIAADNDTAGLSAAERLRHRLADRIAVVVAPSPEPFKDWNDWLRERAATA